MAVSEGFRLQQKGERAAAALPPLLVAAERVATTVAQGVHGRRRVGLGETFWQFRSYEPGDAPQRIDWRQTAKSERVYVREMEWEAAQSVWLWRDGSPSMDWTSSPALPKKQERAEVLLLGLAVLLLRAGERVGLITSPRLPTSGRATLSRLALDLARLPDARRDEIGDTAGELPPLRPLPRHAQLVLLGDFLAPLVEIERLVRSYAERGVVGHLLQVLDPAEASLPFSGRVRFEGLEGEEPWLLSRAETVREAYIKRLTLQCEGLRDIARRAGWTAGLHRTDRSPESGLLSLYAALAREPGASA